MYSTRYWYNEYIDINWVYNWLIEEYISIPLFLRIFHTIELFRYFSNEQYALIRSMNIEQETHLI